MLSGTPRTFVGSTTFTVAGMSCGECQRGSPRRSRVSPGSKRSPSPSLPGLVTVAAARLVDRTDIAVDEAGYALVP
jgi:copper chaperone CopZ